MPYDPYNLNHILSKGVAEIVFDRRHLRPDAPPFRRILCTANWNLLYSKEGREILNFVPPKNLPAYWPPDHNLVYVWCIFSCWWRALPCESVQIVRMIPEKDWWPFFHQYIRPMTPQQKSDFMKI